MRKGIKMSQPVITLEDSKKKLLHQFVYLYEQFQKNEDYVRCEKIIQLAKKLSRHEKIVAFCGHFSAGKSSMINKLVGEDVLPSSPIPTSANLVKIFSGDESFAKVYFHNGKILKYLAPYNINEIKNYSKDGNEIHSVEISSSSSSLPQKTVVMDTPGIDSTDEAHKLATESALYLADIVIYVMDYNHVQSEQNFLFTKEMVEQKKRLVLVINQIDKHKEDEIPFETFKQSVIDSFASWGVRPEKIFFTSLKEKDHPKNEFLPFIQYMAEKLNRINVETSFESSIQMLLNEHFQWKMEKWEEKKVALEESAGNADNSSSLENYFQEKERYELKRREIEQYFLEEIQSILKNAYLMPAQTRELAKSYLESIQPNFKIGMLFTKKKTEEVRKNREEQFIHDLVEKIDSQLIWHVKALLQNIRQQLDVKDEKIYHEIDCFSIEMNGDIIKSLVKSGAEVNGDYVLNYTNELADYIKKDAKINAEEIFGQLKQVFTSKEEEKIETYEHMYFSMHDLQDRMEELLKEKEDIVQSKENLIKGLSKVPYGRNEDTIKNYMILWTTEPTIEMIESSKQQVENANHHQVTMEKGKEPKEMKRVTEVNTIRPEEAVTSLKKAANIIKGIPALDHLVHQLRIKAERIEQKSFTVALFGAFSAGKSSFANALIGENVLPVSPNPTTASINKILPPTDNYKHATARVKLKSKEMMFSDINDALEKFQIKSSNFNDSFSKIHEVLETKQMNHKTKAFYSFLKAFVKGYPEVEGKLGETIIVQLEEFQQIVSLEEKSCFVEWIELYYDCPLTRMGITLVDTPGADSINARHTGVAFDYIKKSDAILYVTYYNHAFSKADREFLIQLGRVKDIFELDKMFFIVNAVDLANSEDELETVLTYIESQLLEYGVRHPNLYPVSSLLALKEKQTKEKLQSRMDVFEKAFYQFIRGELMNLAILSAREEFNRALSRLHALIDESRMDEETKKKRKHQILQEKEKANQKIQQASVQVLQQQIVQEIEELTFYIKQRVFFRFQDFFKDSFNPSILRGSRSEMKDQLQEALKELLHSISFDLSQEMRATTLRVESFMNKRLSEWKDSICHDLMQLNDHLSFSLIEWPNVETPTFPESFHDLDLSTFKKALSYFKNAKSFFENDEKRYMKEELEKQLEEPVKNYVQEQKSLLIQTFEKQVSNNYQLLINQLQVDVKDYYDSSMFVLEQVVNSQELENNLKELKQLQF